MVPTNTNLIQLQILHVFKNIGADILLYVGEALTEQLTCDRYIIKQGTAGHSSNVTLLHSHSNWVKSLS